LYDLIDVDIARLPLVGHIERKIRKSQVAGGLAQLNRVHAHFPNSRPAMNGHEGCVANARRAVAARRPHSPVRAHCDTSIAASAAYQRRTARCVSGVARLSNALLR